MVVPAPAWPLKIGPTRRYLVDQKDQPVLVQGDSPWSLIVVPTPEEAERYLERRRAQGFNTLLINLIEHKFAPKPPFNHASEPPFSDQPFGQPNEKYFAHADWLIRKAGEYGMQVFLTPCFFGTVWTPNEGWAAEVANAGPTRLYEYGRYVGRRYRDFDNLFWIIGADRNPKGSDYEAMRAMARGIREQTPRHLMSAHPSPDYTPIDAFPQDVNVPEAEGGRWLDVQFVYSYALVHRKLINEYNRKPTMPYLLIESSYEGEHNASEVQIRRQAYWSILLGGCGQFMGNRPIWPCLPGWQDCLDSPGATQMAHLKRLFDSRPWWRLVPDLERKVVTSGLGEFNGMDFLSAAVTDDGATLMAHMPTGRAITVDTSKLSGSSLRGWWFSPRSGEATDGGELAGGGTLTLDPPDREDWVLVLDDATQNLPRPGEA